MRQTVLAPLALEPYKQQSNQDIASLEKKDRAQAIGMSRAKPAMCHRSLVYEQKRRIVHCTKCMKPKIIVTN